jgi:hypothetical protein
MTLAKHDGVQLRQLIPNRLLMTPKVIADGRWYEYSGLASYGRLLTGLVRVQGLVPPAGFEGLWNVQVRGIVQRRSPDLMFQP